jgi:hypothetical protein
MEVCGSVVVLCEKTTKLMALLTGCMNVSRDPDGLSKRKK